MIRLIEIALKYVPGVGVAVGGNWQYVSIVSCNSMAPDRRQAITWTNDD